MRMQSSSKPQACVPCHQRKVRCNATEVGTPCTRCVSKNRVEMCVLVERPRNRSSRRGIRFNDNRSNQRIQTSNSVTTSFHDCLSTSNNQQNEATSKTADATTQTTLISVLSEKGESTQHLSVESNSTPRVTSSVRRHLTSNDVDPSPYNALNSGRRRIVVEYYNPLNPGTIMGESLKRPRRRGLVQTDDVGSSSLSARERELSGLDSIDRAYLQQRRVHELPPEKVCDNLLSLFFQHIHTYLPILDSQRFIQEYRKGTCSTFLLYAVFIAVIPLASDSHLHSTGYTDVIAAETEFFTRARILYDFSCEQSELVLLQGSILLSWFQHSLDSTKVYRFWFSNATRLAMQMGLHRSDIEVEVDKDSYRLCRRIWWVLMQRDVFRVISGVEGTRRLVDEESDTPLLEMEDFDDNPTDYENPDFEGVVAHLQKRCFIESCKLAKLGAKFLHLFQRERLSPTMIEVREFEHEIDQWQTCLPKEFDTLSATNWDCSNACTIMLQMQSYQLKIMFYRSLVARMSSLQQKSIEASNEQLFHTLYKASLLLQQAMEHDIIHFMPPLLIECIAQLTAIHVELVQYSESTAVKTFDLETNLTDLVKYFRIMGRKWPSASLYHRLFSFTQGEGGRARRGLLP